VIVAGVQIHYRKRSVRLVTATNSPRPTPLVVRVHVSIQMLELALPQTQYGML